jgi:hypothetical protein
MIGVLVDSWWRPLSDSADRPRPEAAAGAWGIAGSSR